MPRPSVLEPFAETIHELRRGGYTYGEVVDWLERLHDIRVTVNTVWRFVNQPSRGPSRGNPRHERWHKRRSEGATLEQIAQEAGVSRQAVHAALKRMDDTGTVTP